MARPYTGNADAPASGTRPGLNGFIKAATEKRKTMAGEVSFWGLTNIGTFSNRLMRSAPAGLTPASPDYKKWVSVHATGRAVDLGWTDRAKAEDFCRFLEKHADALGIEEIHDYDYVGPSGQWGRGWRCNRNGVAGWKIYDANDNAGTPGGDWIHVEISPAMAADEKKAYDTFKAEFEKYLGQKRVEDYLKGLSEEAKKKAEEEKKLSKEELEKRKKNRQAAKKALEDSK
jgi:hypothetical protein